MLSDGSERKVLEKPAIKREKSSLQLSQQRHINGKVVDIKIKNWHIK